jgi:hypothetical protein
MKCVLLTALLLMAVSHSGGWAKADTTATVLSTIRSVNGPDSLENKPTLEKWEDGSASPPQVIHSKYDDIYKDIRHPVLKTAIHESLAGRPIYDFQLRGLNNQLYYDSIAQGVYLQRNKAFVMAENEAIAEFLKRVIGRTKQNIIDCYGPPSVDLGNKTPWSPDKLGLTYAFYSMGYKNEQLLLTFESEKCTGAEVANDELIRQLYSWQIPDRYKTIGSSEAEIIKRLGAPGRRLFENGASVLVYPMARNGYIKITSKNGICTDCETLMQCGWNIKPGSIQNRK